MAERGKEPVLDMDQVGDLPSQVHGPRHRAGGRVEADERPAAGRFARVAAQGDPELIRAGGTAWGWPGTGRVAVTPSVVVFSPESRITTNSTEPTTATIDGGRDDRDPEAPAPRIARAAARLCPRGVIIPPSDVNVARARATR